MSEYAYGGYIGVAESEETEPVKLADGSWWNGDDWVPASGSVKLWVDDLRPVPDDTWTLATTSRHAIRSLLACYQLGVKVKCMSLDHDLGGDDTTRAIVLWLCGFEQWPESVRVHTANPVGREWLVGMTERYGPGVTTD